MTFAEKIEAGAGGEAIEAIVIGRNEDLETPEIGMVVAGVVWATPPFPDIMYNDCLSWADARPYLDYPHTGGFGLFDCHPVYVWTASWVLVIGEYDGSTHVVRIPRHPVASQPEFI